jgi:hypothetical protein
MTGQKRLIIRVGLSTLLIASLVVLMITIFGEPSPHAYNARTIAQLQQYVTALELVRLEKGTYPITTEFICVGDYADDRCWDKNGEGVIEDPQFNDMLDAFIPLLSSGQLIKDEHNSENNREGYVYRSRLNGRGYEIQYLLIGKNRQCGFGQDLSISVSESRGQENTLCTILR